MIHLRLLLFTSSFFPPINTAFPYNGTLQNTGAATGNFLGNPLSYPLRRSALENIHVADPEKDIDRVCTFLASDDASYITSETITLQGGSGLRPQALFCNHPKH